MGRGGKWSWKWFVTSAVAWFGVIRGAIWCGDYFQISIFSTLQSFGLYGLAGVAVASILLAPLTFLAVHAFNGIIRIKLDSLAREEQKISRYCRLVHDEKRFQEHQLRLVAEANEFIVATGSRSRNKQYLESIEKRLQDVSTLTYTRILFGEIRREELRQHCLRLATNMQVSTRAKICEITDLNRHTESFIISNEKESLIVIPSFNAIAKFDSCLLLTGTLHRQMRGIVESYARAAGPWTPQEGRTQ